MVLKNIFTMQEYNKTWNAYRSQWKHFDWSPCLEGMTLSICFVGVTE